MDYYNELINAYESGQSFASAVIVETQGSTPRHPGTKMIVFADGSFNGTIGGGEMEQRVLHDALDCIQADKPLLRDYELVHANGQTGMPGGRIRVFIDPCTGKIPLIICGAGHVGGKLIGLANMLGFAVTVMDIRDPQTLQERIVGAKRFITAETFAEGLKQVPDRGNTYYLVCSFSPIQDEEILESILHRKAAYIGMLGSKKKAAAIFDHLRQKGVCEAAIQTVHAPVGLDLGAETPEEIALAIAAELLQTKNGNKMKTGQSPYRI